MPPSCTQIPHKTEHSIKDRLYWSFLNLIPFLTGSIAIARDSLKWVAVYTGIAVFFLLIIQLRFTCVHSINYIWNKGCIKCSMLSEMQQIFKYRPGFHSPFEKMMIALGALIIFLFPIYWLFRDPLLLGAYVIAWALLFSTFRRYGGSFETNLKKRFGNNFKEKDIFSGSPDLSGGRFWVVGENRSTFLKMKHEFRDFLYWNFVTLTLLLSAGVAIGIHSTGWLLAYIFVVFFHFNILEQRFFCTHCPYFPKEGNKLRCMMNWGWPKHFKPRPYPPGKFDLAITTLGFLIVIFFPIPWLLKEPFLMGAYSVSILIFLLTIWKYECSHCIYFGCPFNRITAEARREFENSKELN